MRLSRAFLIDKIVEYYFENTIEDKQRKIGAEIEKIAVDAHSGERISYHGKRGIGEFLKFLAKDYGKVGEIQDDFILSLSTPDGDITLEPGAQLELATHAWDDIHQLNDEWHRYLTKVFVVSESFGYSWLTVGIDPMRTAEQVALIPKNRYRIMADYLPKKGALAADMMRLTTSVQVNLDYTGEEDAMSALQTGLALSPFMTALFANSPIVNKCPSGFLSHRAFIWNNTDPDRCGLFSALMDKENCTFVDYAERLVELPLMFRYDDNNEIIPASGCTLLDWLKESEQATPENIKVAIQQFFTEVRLKAFLEFRGADCPPSPWVMAIPAIWAGLIYDRPTRDRARDLCQATSSQRMELWRDVARKGLKAEFSGKPVADIACQLLDLAEEGLRKRARRNDIGEDETVFLIPVKELAQQGKTPADLLLEKWRNASGDIRQILPDICY